MILLVSQEELRTYKATQLVPLQCMQCQAVFERQKNYVLASIKGSNRAKLNFCCRKCSDNSKIKRQVINCYTCNKQFERTPKDIQQKNFCSRSCSAIENNKTIKKRKPEGSCAECGSPCYKCRKLCKSCNEKRKFRSDTITIAEMKLQYGNRAKIPGFISTRIREYCRRTNKHLLGLPCENCSYALHTELCHIKSISEFNDDAKVSDINSSDNIANLCPNCHWEFDKGLLPLSNFRKSSHPDLNRD